MSSKPELVYFDGRGRAEIIRIVLAAAGIEFNEHDLKTRNEYLSLQPDLLFKQVPMLRVDGMNLVQSSAIVRHIGRKAGFLGGTELEQTRVDELYEGTRDAFLCLCAFFFNPDEEAVKEMITTKMDKYLPVFNKVLSESGSSYLVGSSLTIADLGLFEIVQGVIDYFGENAISAHYPPILKFYANLTSQEKIQKYLNEIRKPKNTADYVKTVREVLEF